MLQATATTTVYYEQYQNIQKIAGGWRLLLAVAVGHKLNADPPPPQTQQYKVKIRSPHAPGSLLLLGYKYYILLYFTKHCTIDQCVLTFAAASNTHRRSLS